MPEIRHEDFGKTSISYLKESDFEIIIEQGDVEIIWETDSGYSSVYFPLEKLEQFISEHKKMVGANKDENSVRALDVMNAAYETFKSYGDELYARKKVNAFLARCGADADLSENQILSMDVVEEAVYGMLDADSEKIFWSHLGK